MEKRVLTIQDISCVGQCSLTVALPIISACGLETAVIPSSVLSTHTGGFEGFTFRDLTDDMPKIEQHWQKENIKFDAVYTGYVSESQIDHIIHIMSTCLNENGLKIVDPAMADNGKLYTGFAPDFPQKMRKLCKNADYLLPNITEAAFLTGEECILSGYGKNYIENLLKKLHSLGAKNVILTGVSFDDKSLGFASYDGEKIYYYFNDKISRMSHGTGDVYASSFVGALIRGFSMNESAEIAADFVCESILATEEEHWYGVRFEKALPYLIERLNQK